MPHHFVAHEDRDKALLYALGLLEAEERRALQEHMHDGCGTCKSEVKSFEAVVEELSYCASPLFPPSRLRQRLLDQVSNERASLAPGEGFPAVRIKRATTMEWEPTSHEGIWAKYLWVDQDKKRSTRLVRVQPGAKIPPHRHLATEEFLILEGYGESMGQVFGPGDYHRAPAGSIHGPSSSKEGCIFVCFSAPLYEVVSDHLVPHDLREMTILRSSLELSPDNADTTIETLFSTGDRPFMTALIRLNPSTNPNLAALHAQEMYVIQGQARLNDLLVNAGDYLYTESESFSGSLQTETGCLLLAHS